MSDNTHNEYQIPDWIQRTVEYSGYQITVGDDYRFTVTGPEWNSERHQPFNSLYEAKQAIDDHLDRLQKQRKAEAKVNVAARDQRGTPVTVRGLHGTTGAALTTPVRHDLNTLYPDVPWIAELLVERAKLVARQEEIEKAVEPYASRAKRSYGRIAAASYGPTLDTFLKELDDKRKKALANAPKASS